MVVVHTALRREFRQAPGLVASADLDRHARVARNARVARVDGHLSFLCDLMHHHHTGEDELLWPVLTPRLTPAERTQVAAGEAQHEGLELALGTVHAARAAWVSQPDATSRDRLIEGLTELHRLLEEHLDFEEHHLLPIAAVKLTPEEWHAVGQAGARSVGASRMLLVLGMFADEGDPHGLATMLATVPAPVRAVLLRLATLVYSRYCVRLHSSAS